MNESTIQNLIRLQVVKLGCILMRNNNGMLQDAHGGYVRYGLGTGTSDLIGWTIINGLAIFTAVEVKAPRGRVTKEQQAFVLAITRNGGIGCIARSSEDVERAIHDYRSRHI